MKLSVKYQDQNVGTLEEIKGSVVFEYDKEFISSGIELSPITLPCGKGVFRHTDHNFHGLPGLFYDALPDAYGSNILNKRFSEKGIGNPTPLMKLAYIGDRAIGALSFEPVITDADERAIISIEEAVEESRKFREGIPTGKVSKAFFGSAGGLGGKQPKTFAGLKRGSDELLICDESSHSDDYDPCILKLDPELDAPVLIIEKLYLDMAARAGIDTPEAKLINHDNLNHLVIKRFDRDGNNKIHQHSLCGVGHMSYNYTNHSYDDYFDIVDQLTNNQEDLLKAYSRLVFNVLTHNHDDHSKNFSFLMKEKNDYTLSPAYDLLYSTTEFGHFMLVNDKRENILYEDIIPMLDDYLVDRRVLNDSINKVIEGVSGFWDLAKEYKLSPIYTKMIGDHIKVSIQNLKPGLKINDRPGSAFKTLKEHEKQDIDLDKI